jgi:hypothetical protein
VIVAAMFDGLQCLRCQQMRKTSKKELCIQRRAAVALLNSTGDNGIAGGNLDVNVLAHEQKIVLFILHER